MSYLVLREVIGGLVHDAGRQVRYPLEHEEYIERRQYPGDQPASLIPHKTTISVSGVIAAVAEPAVPPLRAAVLNARYAFDGWTAGLEIAKNYFDTQDVLLGLTFLAQGWRGLRGVVLSDHWSVSQRIAFAGRMAQGAANVQSPAGFFAFLERQRLAGNVVSAPPGRMVWVDPATGTAWDLANAARLSVPLQVNLAPEPASIEENASDTWPQRITV